MCSYKVLSSFALCAVIASVMHSSPAAAQGVNAGMGLFAGSHRVGVEVEAMHSGVGLFGRFEGFPLSDSKMWSVGGRWRPLGATGPGPYGSIGLHGVNCSTTDVSGGATPCDGDYHLAGSIGLGVQVPFASRISAFADGAILRGESPDVPNWTFAAGVRLIL